MDNSVVGSAWEEDEHGCLNLHIRDADGCPVHAWLTPRPGYCDRGHWQASADWIDSIGIPPLDHQDGFPRYYMELDTAKREMELWLDWRLFKRRSA